ncbi:hypothetical protein BbINS_02693 [Bartonella bacilliformis INS]|uniref:Uncharacterized protein n=2 Tax=Bartonella bacilliformis TaxID=774 RepID=A1USD2_BARBK|nr:hypothetical protein BARBAKC583_0576 [Bartonella bacilliformis KC583]EKS44806.1 hypothetical protein BbINS_02693 [Bartonella bacilliformis INS]
MNRMLSYAEDQLFVAPKRSLTGTLPVRLATRKWIRTGGIAER